MESALFFRFKDNFRPVWRFWEFWPSKMRFGQNVLRMTSKERFVQFSWEAHCFPVLKKIWDKCNDFEKFDPQKYDLGKTLCAWPKTSVLYNFHEKFTFFFRFEKLFRPVWRFWELWRSKMRCGQNVLRITWKKRFVQFSWKAHCFPFFRKNLRPVWRFWQLWRSQIRFGQNVLRMTWKEGFVQFSWKAHCFPVLERIWGQRDDFDNFDFHKFDLAKTCCAWREKSVLCNFHEKRTLFPFLREFQASVTLLRTLTLKHAIWPKRVAHDLKTAFCPIFMESALFFRFEETLRRVSRFWELWQLKMRFGQNVLRMTWKKGFVQFSWKAHCFAFLERIWGQCDDFDNFDAHKCDLAKTCSAWPE